MKNSTSNINKKIDENISIKYTIIGVIVLILFWKLLSLRYKAIILPSPELTFMTIKNMIFSGEFWVDISYSFFRVGSGYLISLLVGSSIGIAMGLNEKINKLVKPLISTLQTIPNISWILLAIIWFGLNSKIVIFTIFISILPIFVINTEEGVKNTDHKLLEMAHIYDLSFWNTLSKIYFPSVKPYLNSAAVITIERAWKIGAMAELLSLDSGIGAGLYWARNNLETEYIFAWTLVLVFLGFFSSKLLKKIISMST
ncbi:MAG TPA: ABC transporter permease [Halanaerobiales bacterium]|nr:ABC transporter permease [Halanaerobiales bacterium]